MPEQDTPYLDKNATQQEKKSGRTRLPMPNEGGEVTKKPEDPYPGKEDRSDSSFERPDEFGDGDRRS